MLINARSLSEQVILPTLHYLNDYSEAANYLLLGTAAVESSLSPFGVPDSISSNNGVGLFNITPSKHTSIWDEYLAFDPDLASKVRGLASQRGFLTDPHSELRTNMSYSAAIAWVIYRRALGKLSQLTETEKLAEYWKVHYRRDCRESQKEDFCNSFNELILGRSTLVLHDTTQSIIDAA